MPDFSVASLPRMLDAVKVLSFAVQQGRVAVHCHAGLGRTGELPLLLCGLALNAADQSGDVSLSSLALYACDKKVANSNLVFSIIVSCPLDPLARPLTP